MDNFLDREVVVMQKDVYGYPEKETIFSPSRMYPEYPFEESTIANQSNMVYEMVRDGFIMLGLDKEKIGTPDWNPLSEFIKPGDYVLLKPNMVLDANQLKENGTDCLITHPSIIRAILDFVVIALGNTGHIVVGDAPLQSCDFDKLVHEQGFDLLVNFYRKWGINVELKDFRLVKSHTKYGLVDVIEKKAGEECTVVNIGNISEQNNEDYERLRVTSYNPEEMKKHHNPKKHEYLVATSVLLADVIINLPKPKTHRKAGLTAALKNLIGINGNKDWLPHHRKGAVSEGGDEYLNRNVFKMAEANMQDIINKQIQKEKKFFFSQILRVLHHGFSTMGTFTELDQYREGSWYGNDTIWRTITDLNRILLYCDKKGRLRKTKQRKIFIIGDMIISGEGEGPLMPTPIKKGILVFGKNPVAFDTVVAEIMGFDYMKIPSIYHNYRKSKCPLVDFDRDEIIVKSNCENILGKDRKGFAPSSGWKGHIEKLNR